MSDRLPAHINNPKLTWQERFKLLEAHHVEESTILWARFREVREELEKASKLPAAVVNEALARLGMHFGEPVLPISRYCKALDAWGEFAVERKIISKGALEDLRIGIHKSNLLARVLYGGEEVRTEMCPLHLGQWHGIEDPERPCIHGCGLTGWLPPRKVVAEVAGV